MSSPRESGTLGTYQRYKLGQAQFQKWLKQTSDKLRLGSAQPPTGSAHLQNSTPKNGANHPGKGSRSKENPKTASALHWSQLESMAQTVIDHSDPEQIPRSAISILRDVVYLRKKSAHFFGQAATRSDNEMLREKNSAHEHIIQVLERILHRFDAFLSTVRPSSSMPGPKEDGQLGMNDINNMFEYLHVEQSHEGENEDREEISDAEATATKRAKKFQKKGGRKQKQKKQPKEQRIQKRKPDSQDNSWVDTFKWVEVDEDEDEDDFDYYMIYCFFQDFNSIRTHITDRWTEYFYHKSVSLDTLAVVTNAACEMFHEMEYELVKTLQETPGLAEYDFMLQTLFFQYGLDHVDYSGEDKLTERERTYKILGEADWLGFFAYTHIVQILDFVPPGKVALIPSSVAKHPKYGCHDFEGFRDFTKDAMFDFFPEICVLKAMKQNGELPMIMCAQDELTLDFEDIFRMRDYSSAAVFVLSLYIDIRYILENQVTDAFDLVQATAARTKTILEDQLSNIRGPWDLRKECRFRLKEIERLILQDFLEEDKLRRLKEKGVTEEFERHLLLKKDPVWSGLLDFRYRLILNSLGYRFINKSSVVLGAAFAYTASRIDETQGLRWPRMDRFFRIHDKDRILRGPLPSEFTTIDLLKRFVDHNLSTISVPFIGLSKSLEALYMRYGSDNGHSRQAMAYLGDIIRDKLGTKAANRVSRQAVILPPGPDERQNPLDVENAVAKRGNPNAAKAQATRGDNFQFDRVSPVQLLEILDETTTSLLENQLSINLFQLHTESVQLLQKLLGEFSSEVESDTPALLDENTRADKLPLLLPAIYRSMAEGNVAEISKRFGKVIGEFCLNL
ncbi:hypothetical protein F4818DRAFT_259322 [Hypoxylon cercidicola]|nr:hypothetical protein F4818DRAFT_259322 [Hypoxylon cercidicola]